MRSRFLIPIAICLLLSSGLLFAQDHHDHRHEEHSSEKHSDIEVEYRFQCERPEQLKALTTVIPAIFPGVETLSVQWIVNGRQSSVTLTKDRGRINFR